MSDTRSKKAWITDDRQRIIEIYRIVCFEKCPGLKPGDELKKTNEEMLDAIFRFVQDKVEAIAVLGV